MGRRDRCCARTPTVNLRSIEVPLRGPKPSQIGDDLAAARDWVAASTPAVVTTVATPHVADRSAGRQIGRNRASRPRSGVLISTSLGTAGRGRERFVASTNSWPSPTIIPRFERGSTEHPHRALDLAAEMPRLIAAFVWLDVTVRSNRYLREISAPGVDTKFAERHRPRLGGMLGRAVDSRGIPAAPWPSGPSPVWFAAARALAGPAGPAHRVGGASEELAQLDGRATDRRSSSRTRSAI